MIEAFNTEIVADRIGIYGDQRPPAADTMKESGMQRFRLGLADAGFNINACGSEFFGTLAGGARVRVGTSDHDTGNTRFDQRIRARRSLTEMGTRLQRDIGRGPVRRLTGVIKGQPFGMGPPARRCYASTDDLSSLAEDTADAGIGCGRAKT